MKKFAFIGGGSFGFTRALVPARNLEKRKLDLPIELIPVKSIYEALRVLRKVDSSESIHMENE